MRNKSILIPRFVEMLIPSVALLFLSLLFAFLGASSDVARILCFVIASVSGVMFLLALLDFFFAGFAKKVPAFEPFLPIALFVLCVIASSLFLFVPVEGQSSWRGLLMVFGIFFAMYGFYYAIRSYFHYFVHRARENAQTFVKDVLQKDDSNVADSLDGSDVIEVEAVDKEETKK